MEGESFDVVIVGGGPGGYVAAIRARQLGLSTALVEREHLGGICLNWGCIPTKALLRASEIQHLLGNLSEFGFEAQSTRFDLQKLVARSRKVSKKLSVGVKHLMKKNGVQVFDGHGRLAGPGKLEVSREGEAIATLTSQHVILATGARARTLPGLEPDGERIWTYREAMVPRELPESLLVVGSGAIGVEFASFYRDLGSEVTMVELLPQILPAEDAEVAAFARKAFERQGMEIYTEASLQQIERRDAGLRAHVQLRDAEAKAFDVSHAIVAVGVTGNVEDVGLETTKARTEGGAIQVDEWCRTDEPGVYAIGDVAGGPQLAHKANHEGVLCVERIAGHAGAHPLQRDAIPGCTYSRPQIASVGLTEEAARAAGRELRVGRFPFQGNGKALAYGDTTGMVKTIFDASSGALLGAHMVGAEVTEMIQGFVLARNLETTEAELMRSIFPHPTISETMHESVLDAFGAAFHV